MTNGGSVAVDDGRVDRPRTYEEEDIGPSASSDAPLTGEPASKKSMSRGGILLIVSFILLASGTFDTMASKMMNKQVIRPCPDCEPRNFEAPWWQTFLMYIGESFCLILYYVDRYFFVSAEKRAEQGGTFDFPTSSASFSKQPCPVYLWVIPTMLDLIGTTLVNYAAIYAMASTVQMLRNFNVVITAIFSIFVIKLALRTYQWVGIVVITIGLSMTGLFSILHPEEDVNTSRASYVGLLFALTGTMMSGFQFVFEERLFRKYYCSPLKAVGLQGVIGLTITGIVLIIGEIQGFEKTPETLYMWTQSTWLSVISVIFTISIAIFNTSGLSCSKLGSGILRVVVVAMRSVSIWIIELIIGWNTFNTIQFVSLIVLSSGTLMYNGVPPIKKETTCSMIWNKPLMCFSFLRNPDHIDNLEEDLAVLPNAEIKSPGSSEQKDDATMAV